MNMDYNKMAKNGMLNLGIDIPKPFCSIILYNSFDIQYKYSNGIAIGEFDGVNYLAYGEIVMMPQYWQYVKTNI